MPATRGRRLYFTATAVVVGAAVMTIEILGARVVGPFHGVSLYAWTALIAVTLFALAAGAAAGGRFADGSRCAEALYVALAAAGLLALALPLMRHAVLVATLPLGLRAGALVAALALFGLPLFLLGCATPALVCLWLRDRTRVGSAVGSVSAWSTGGSLLGTLATGFVLLEHAGVDAIFRGLGLLLVLVAAGWFTAFGDRRMLAAALVTLATGVALAGVGGDGTRTTGLTGDGTRAEVVARHESAHGTFAVVDYRHGDRHVREMLLDGQVQGGIDVAALGAYRGASIYETAVALALVPRAAYPAGRRALVVGLGPGVVPMLLARAGVAVEVVDIAAATVPLAADHFGFDRSVPVHVADARAFLRGSDVTWDFVLFDVFAGDTTPAHLLSVEAFRLARARLAPDGILAANLMASLRGDAAALAAIVRTLGAVFRHVEIRPLFDPATGDGTGNVLVLARDTPLPTIDADALARAVIDLERVHPLARDGVRRALTTPFPLPGATANTPLLTDDHNPIDFLDLGLKERLRRHLIESTPHEVLGALPHRIACSGARSVARASSPSCDVLSRIRECRTPAMTAPGRGDPIRRAMASLPSMA